ncbi:MAG: hypothetical protein FWF27_04170 [Candidatus Bathyarchaeota archaeon]|nr:hypothetical protein [Candidatus Termiticorpusculum sp.]
MEERKKNECECVQPPVNWFTNVINANQKMHTDEMTDYVERLSDLMRIIGGNQELPNAGICNYHKKFAFMGDKNDVQKRRFLLNTAKGLCELSQRCLVLNCDFNITTPESFACNSNITSKEDVKELKRNWRYLTNLFARLQPVIHDKRMKVFCERL